MSNLSIAKKITILVIILALPGFLYYMLQEKGKNRYRPLPILGPKQVAMTFHVKRGKKIPDTIYHQIRRFHLINQDGDSVSFPRDTSTITIVNFFFTKCSDICKNRQNALARIVQSYQKNPLLHFVSITIDGDHDKVEQLHLYIKNYPIVSSGKWSFLTGSQQFVHQLAKKDFLVDVMRDTTKSNDFIISPYYILVDHKRQIRGYYDADNQQEVSKLADEIKVLIAELLRGVKNR